MLTLFDREGIAPERILAWRACGTTTGRRIPMPARPPRRARATWWRSGDRSREHLNAQ